MCAFKLSKLGFSDTVVAASLVHDVLEDSKISKEEIRNELGEEVINIVTSVTEDKNLAWEERKRRYVEKVKRGKESVKAVSIADKIHNMESLLRAYNEQGEVLWDKFNQGKEKKLWFEKEMLNVFKQTWDHSLVGEYEKLVKQMEELK